jgi:hypothetical protein
MNKKTGARETPVIQMSSTMEAETTPLIERSLAKSLSQETKGASITPEER